MPDQQPDDRPRQVSRRAALTVVAAGLLAGCGGGPSTGAPSPTPTGTQPTSPTGTPQETQSPPGTEPTDTTASTETATPSDDPLTWATATDWNRSVSRSGIVNGPWTTSGADSLQLGYPGTALGLEAYYALNAPSERAVTDAAGDHDGTLEGDVGSVTGIHNSPGYGFADGYAAISSPPVAGTSTPITVAFWLQTEADSRAYQDDYMWHHRDGDDEFGVTLDSEGDLYAFTANADTLAAPRPQSINDGQWHHIAVVFDQPGSTVRQYVDGELDTRATDYGETVELNPGIATLGAAVGGEKTLDGAIDDFRWYSRALSDDEVATLYRRTTRGTLQTGTVPVDEPMTPDLVGLDYELNDGDITVTVVGDPEGTTTERQTVTLDGASEYTLPWTSVHRAFTLKLAFESPSISKTPVLSRVRLA